MQTFAALALAAFFVSAPALAATPGLQGLEDQRQAALEAAQAATGDDARCTALDTAMTLAWRESSLYPGSAEVGLAGWAATCAGDYPDRAHVTWDEADNDFKAELVAMQTVATGAYNASEAQSFDQVCTPLRHGIAMLIHARARIDEMDQLAAPDQRATDTGYRAAVDDTLGKITPDGAEACADGTYHPPMVERTIDQTHSVTIPQSLADQLDAHEQKRQDYLDRYYRFKEQLGPDMDSEVQSNICADMNIMWESQQGEIAELDTMADLAKAYPDLAKSYTAAVDAINEANYGIGAPTCGS